MGLIDEYSPTKNNRISTIISKTAVPIASSSIETMGGVFILLDAKVIQGSLPVRLRLYSDSQSMVIDANRPSSSFALSESVALISDINLRDFNTLTFNPPIIGNTENGGQVWYNLSSSITPSAVRLTVYNLSDLGDSQDNKSNVLISGSQVTTTGNGVSGSITTPKSFLILTGSATSESRLRLYSRPVEEVPTAEKTRPFETQANSGSLLIADLLFNSGGFGYPLVPVLEAYTWTQDDYQTGTGQVGYILQNRSAGTTNITASLKIFSTED